MRTNYVLIDYENVQVKSLELLKDEQFQVKVFLGINNRKLPTEFVISKEALGERAEYIRLEKAGENALDFHIAYYLGRIAVSDESAFFHIISKDKGFDPLIAHLKSVKIFSARSDSIEKMPCFGQGSTTFKSKKPYPKIHAELSVINENGKVALKHLIGLKASKPRKLKTLKSTIHAKLGKSISNDLIDDLISTFVNLNYLIINEQKVTYKLPAKI